MSRFDPFEQIIFEVSEDEIDGGYNANAIGYSIHTHADSLEELRANVRDAVHTHFETKEFLPDLIRPHFVREEVLTP
jgi:hypothetical protein